ncbi:hypothetical protein [Rufibacter roseus]|nr:hypothetical protein [Rufibacter roseus]
MLKTVYHSPLTQNVVINLAPSTHITVRLSYTGHKPANQLNAE